MKVEYLINYSICLVNLPIKFLLNYFNSIKLINLSIIK